LGLRVLEYIFAFLTSPRAGIVVMVILALLSFVGASIPQGGSEQAYIEAYGRFQGGLIWKLGFADVFRADYFTFLLVLLCIMVFACALKRLPRRVKLASGRPFIFDEERLARMSKAGKAAIDLEAEEAVLHILDICKRHRYRAWRKVEGEKQAVFASKSGFSRYGSFILHLSFIFLLAGGLASTRLGTRYLREVRTGESFVLERSAGDSTLVRVEDFTVETDERGRLSDYVCEVTLEVDDTIIRRYRIRPNHPLVHGGREVYLVSYAEDTAKPEAFALSVFDSLGNVVAPHIFAPVDVKNYIDELGGAIQATLGVFPGVRFFSDDGIVRTYLLQRDVEPPGEVEGKYQFVIMYGVPAIAVTLEVVREPFQGFILAGLALLTAGTFVSLYLSHRRIWFIVTGLPEDRSRVVYGGNASRNPEGFGGEFASVRRTLDELA
jgi:cytochrome c biogenesis protein